MTLSKKEEEHLLVLALTTIDDGIETTKKYGGGN